MKRCFTALLLLLLLAGLCTLTACLPEPRITEYSDIGDYGVIKGTGSLKSNYRAKKEFQSFFPAEIDPSFEDVKYHYKAIDDFTYAFEASLEFRIPDSAAYHAYIAAIAPEESFTPFPYDEHYLEYLPQRNYLDLCEPEPDRSENGEGTEFYRIESAKICRVLIDPSEQKVYFVLLRVKDDYWTKTTDLDDFFSRFDIDPKELETRLKEENKSA